MFSLLILSLMNLIASIVVATNADKSGSISGLDLFQKLFDLEVNTIAKGPKWAEETWLPPSAYAQRGKVHVVTMTIRPIA